MRMCVMVIMYDFCLALPRNAHACIDLPIFVVFYLVQLIIKQQNSIEGQIKVTRDENKRSKQQDLFRQQSNKSNQQVRQ